MPSRRTRTPPPSRSVVCGCATARCCRVPWSFLPAVGQSAPETPFLAGAAAVQVYCFSSPPSQVLRIAFARGGSVVDVPVNLQRAHLKEKQQTRNRETATSDSGGGGGVAAASYTSQSMAGCGWGGLECRSVFLIYNRQRRFASWPQTQVGSFIHSPHSLLFPTQQYRRAQGTTDTLKHEWAKFHLMYERDKKKNRHAVAVIEGLRPDSSNNRRRTKPSASWRVLHPYPTHPPTHLVRVSLDGRAADNEELAEVPGDVPGCARRGLEPREQRGGPEAVHLDLRAGARHRTGFESISVSLSRNKTHNSSRRCWLPLLFDVGARNAELRWTRRRPKKARGGVLGRAGRANATAVRCGIPTHLPRRGGERASQAKGDNDRQRNPDMKQK